VSIRLEKLEDASAYAGAVKATVGPGAFFAYRFCDDFGEEHKRYDVFKIVHPRGVFVLKHFDRPDRCAAEQAVCALFRADLPVPRLIGFSGDSMVTEFIEGNDLKEMTDGSVSRAAASVAEIMNAFPPGSGYDRTVAEKEIAYRAKRLACLEGEPLLHRAYTLFLDRMKEMPLTLANGDLVPINCIDDGKRVYLIDWEYGGFMPYALDVRRFLAHSGEHAVYPYRMSDAQKTLFCDRIYEALHEKPDRSVFDRDVRLAVFDEWIMIVSWYLKNPDEPKDETFFVYSEKANALAKELLS
jgi:hypothetical protein